VRAQEADREVRNGMRVRRGEGAARGVARDREGQDTRREAFERWRAEREVVWAREDVLGRLDRVGLQVLDRMLRLDEESRAEAADSGDEEGCARQKPSADEAAITLRPAASSSSPVGGGARHATTPPPSSPPPTLNDDDIEDDDAPGAIPSDLSPAPRRRIHNRLYIRCKRAEASGGVALLDPARLKPGRKASATGKSRRPRGDTDEQPARGDTRPYKIQSELECLGIDADYLRANGMDLFHLGALGRLMLCLHRGS